MHISTTALSVVLLSIIEGSKTAHAALINTEPNQDAFGVTNYGFKCFDRVYPKFQIYAAAKHFCDIIQSRPDLRFRSFKDTGHRNKFPSDTIGDVINHLKPTFHILPILEDGTIYPFELEPESRLVKNLAGEMVKIDPGPDRLVVDLECNIKGAFIDLDYRIDTAIGKVKECRVLKSIEDYFTPSVSSSSSSQSRSSSISPPRRSSSRSPERFRRQSLRQSLERSPERSRQHSTGRPREQSPERSSQRFPESSTERSPERSREHLTGRPREQSPERLSQRFPESSTERSPERSREHLTGRPREQSPE